MRPPDPVPPLKQQLARELVDRLEGWTQVYAAEYLRTDQPRVSNLRNARLERMSLEQLVRFVTRTRGTVTLQVEWTPHFAYGRPSSRAAPPRTRPAP